MLRRVLSQIVRSYEWLRERSIFQKFVILLALWSWDIQAQTFKWDPEGMTSHISHGDLSHLSADTVMWIVEKPGDRWVTQWIDPDRAGRKFQRLSKGYGVALVEEAEEEHFFVVGVGCEAGECVQRLRFIVEPSSGRILSIEVLRCDW